MVLQPSSHFSHRAVDAFALPADLDGLHLVTSIIAV
jgi:hypothetical protein